MRLVPVMQWSCGFSESLNFFSSEHGMLCNKERNNKVKFLVLEKKCSPLESPITHMTLRGRGLLDLRRIGPQWVAGDTGRRREEVRRAKRK